MCVCVWREVSKISKDLFHWREYARLTGSCEVWVEHRSPLWQDQGLCPGETPWLQHTDVPAPGIGPPDTSNLDKHTHIQWLRVIHDWHAKAKWVVQWWAKFSLSLPHHRLGPACLWSKWSHFHTPWGQRGSTSRALSQPARILFMCVLCVREMVSLCWQRSITSNLVI